MRLFPICLKLTGRRVLVVGEGETAERKSAALRECGADIVHVATFHPSDLEGCAVAIGASMDAEIMQALYRAACAVGIPVNVVDQPDLCSYFTPAIVHRDPIMVAISSSGTAPVLARLLRERIETLVAPAFGRLALIADEFTTRFRSRWPDVPVRRQVLESLLGGQAAELVFQGRDEEARQAFTAALLDQPVTSGIVTLIAAGAGAADLLTLRSHRLMGEADIVVHDHDVPADVVAMARRDSQKIELDAQIRTAQGETVVDLLTRLALAGRRVVHLTKADDAALRDQEATLHAQGVLVQISPGVAM